MQFRFGNWFLADENPSKKGLLHGRSVTITKPYLDALQGLLRLDHCFVTPKNEEATVLEVDVGKDQKGKVVMAPGDGQTRSEHDQVSYKSGYDTGPSNPLPQDER